MNLVDAGSNPVLHPGNDMHKIKGKLKYDPLRKGLNDRWRAVLDLPYAKDMAAYYRYWTMLYPHKYRNPDDNELFTHLDIVPWSWGIHVSIAKGKKPKNPSAWKKYEGELITVEYEPIVRVFHYPQDIDHVFYLNVYSDRLQEIKNELYGERNNPWDFHVTIGKTHFSRK